LVPFKEMNHRPSEQRKAFGTQKLKGLERGRTPGVNHAVSGKREKGLPDATPESREQTKDKRN